MALNTQLLHKPPRSPFTVSPPIVNGGDQHIINSDFPLTMGWCSLSKIPLACMYTAVNLLFHFDSNVNFVPLCPLTVWRNDSIPLTLFHYITFT